MSHERLGFVGLGNMGEPMAHRLAAAGVPLTVFDLRPGSADRCARAGAVVADSLAAVARTCARVAICVNTERQVLDVVGDLLAEREASPLGLLLVHSTVTPSTIDAVRSLADPHGVAVVDAPVSGDVEARENGGLTMLVGGAADDVARVADVLDVCGGAVHHVGGVGAGAALKLVNNVLALIGLQATIEARNLAAGYGLDLGVVAEAVRVSTGDNWAMRHVDFWQKLFVDHPQGNGDAFYELMRKDLGLAVAAGAARGVQLPLVDAAYEVGFRPYRAFWNDRPTG